jgi:hypothetical protein
MISSEPDDLFTLRTLFWIGSYRVSFLRLHPLFSFLTSSSHSQAAINEASALTKINAALKQEKEEYVYRSYLGLGQYNIILSEVSDSPNTPVGKDLPSARSASLSF